MNTQTEKIMAIFDLLGSAAWENESTITPQQGEDALNILGPVVCAFLASQSQKVAMIWIETILAMYEKRREFSHKVTKQ